MSRCKLIILFIVVFFLANRGPVWAEEAGDSSRILSAGAGYLPSDSIFAEYLEGKGYHITYGNKLNLISSGKEKFRYVFDDIARAHHHIHLEYFNFRGDSISKELFTRLAQREKDGVIIRAMFDSFGNLSNNRPLRKKDIRLLNQQGIQIVPFDPIKFPYLNHALSRDHQKIIVVDGLIGYTGGMNIADYYINGLKDIGPWRDMHVRIEGPAVEDLQKAFFYSWKHETKQEPEGDDYFPYSHGLVPDTCTDRAVVEDSLSSPVAARSNYTYADTAYVGGGTAIVQRIPHKFPKAMRQAYVAAIDAAERNIQIINPYFTPTRSVRKALYRAIRRGVKVEIMLPTKSDIPFSPHAGFYYANRMRKAGAHVYSFDGGFHHSKVMMIDGRFCTVGSTNLDSRSLRYDYEINAFLFDMRITDQLSSIFAHDKLNSTRYTFDVHRKRGGWKRFVGWFAHLLTPFI